MTTENNTVGPTKPQPVSQESTGLTPPRKPASRILPKWEVDVRERIKVALRRYTPPLTNLVQRDANEGDTRLLVTDFLCDALGFDKFADLTTEYLVKGEFADYGVRIDKELIAFIEVKRATTKLATKHLHQVEMYAVNEGVEWVFLTNGAMWRVYHITGGLPIILDQALEVDLLGAETPQKKADKLFYITREALKRRLIDELWLAQRATSPKALARVLLAPIVVATIQKELKRQSGHKIEVDEVTRLLKTTILRPECFEK